MTESLLGEWTDSLGGALGRQRPARAPATFVRSFSAGYARVRARARDRGAAVPDWLKQGGDFVFASDGYPVSADAEGERASPASGASVMRAYLDRFTRSLDPELLLAAERVAAASLGRMEPCADGLAFFYDERTGTRVPRNPDRHYSALTQSNYLIAFWRLAEAVRDGPMGRRQRRAHEQRWRESAQALLRSLLVPVEAGGVLYEHQAGPVLASTPALPHHVNLNGWLATAQNVGTFARATGDEQAAVLFKETIRALEAYLPTFDAPAFHTSRPASTGFGLFALELPESSQTHWISDAKLRVPAEASYPVAGERDLRHGRWRSAMLSPPPTGDSWVVRTVAKLNLVLNRLSYPEPNVLRLQVDCAVAGTLRLMLAARTYEPLIGTPPDGALVEIARAAVRAGSNEVALAVPWEACELVVYPSPFAVRDGALVNPMHTAHVDRLARLARTAGSEVLAGWRTRWEGYAREWSRNDTLRASGSQDGL